MVKEYIDNYIKELKKCIEDIKHKETFYKQIPNLLTFSRILGMIPINILFFTGNTIPAIILTGLILSTDFFDGKLARKYNVQSKFGADLDAVCDKFMFLGLSLPLIISNPILITNFIFEAIIAFINVLGRVQGLDTKTIFAGKIKTWFLSSSILAGYLVKFFSINSNLLSVLSCITLGSQIITVDNYIKEYKRMKRIKEKQEIDITNNQIEESNDNVNKQINDLKREREFLIESIKTDKENKPLVRIKKKK